MKHELTKSARENWIGKLLEARDHLTSQMILGMQHEKEIDGIDVSLRISIDVLETKIERIKEILIDNEIVI